MKTINHFKTARDKTLHIETEGAIVNIRVGLSGTYSDEVTSIEILPAAGWALAGLMNNRVFKREVVCESKH